MKNLVLFFIFIWLACAPVFGQSAQIAFQGFEGTANDTWPLISGADRISSNLGTTDTPPNQRIRTGIKSWQVSNANALLELDACSVINYDSVVIILRISSPSVNATNGSDATDSINLFVALNGGAFPTVPDLSLRGNNNARWGYTALLTASAIAGTPAYFSAPQSGTSTNNYSLLMILIPSGTQQVALRVQAKNNSDNEFWCIDDIEIRGHQIASGPYIYQPAAVEPFMIAVHGTDNRTIPVAFQSLVSGLYATLSGLNTNQFSVIPDSFAAHAGSPALFQIVYHPNSTGQHTATLTFSSEGAASRSLSIEGRALAIEPAYQPTNLEFIQITQTSMQIRFQRAVGLPDGYLVLRKAGFPPSSLPSDGTAYSIGAGMGDAVVAYTGSDTVFTDADLYPGNTYYYIVFSYNGTGIITNYLTLNPLSGMQTTAGNPSGSIFPSLYGKTLIDSLRYYFKTTTTLGYDNARNKMFGSIDNFNDTVQCVYTGDRIQVLNNTGSPKDSAYLRGFNTEHTWPQSLGATGIAASDLHHLFPTRADVNNARGNLPFNDIPDPLTQKWWRLNYNQTSIPTSFIDEYSESRSVDFEPREDHKGNVARAMFYFYTMYKEQSDTNFFHAQKNVLLQWHYLDPADYREFQRNDTIAFFQQKKKNPFILDSTLIRRAYFPPTLNIHDKEIKVPGEIYLYPNYPNPFNPSTTFEFFLPQAAPVQFVIYNALGQEVITLLHDYLPAGKHTIHWNGKNKEQNAMPSGVYIFRLYSGNQMFSRKLLLLK